MFILPNGQPISPDVPFTLDGISYPANWLRLATPEERVAIGIPKSRTPSHTISASTGAMTPKEI